ncbi:MAG: histidine kinase N-terminal 7TM domain-containing protein [Chloroflexota bacterium]
MLASVAFLATLGLYAWRHRTTPGAISFTTLMFVGGLTALASAFEAASLDFPTQFFWFRVQNTLMLIGTVCALCFALEYSGLVGWLSRRNIALLLSPTLAIAALTLSLVGDGQGLRAGNWLAERLRGGFEPVSLALHAYAIVLMVLSTAVFVALFVRSPLHRKPVAVILVGHLAPRAAYLLETFSPLFLTPLNLTVLGFDFTCLMYAIALFRFRLFDVVPVARASVVERMADAVVVLDAGQRVADLNQAAQRLLGDPRQRGRDANAALAAIPGLAELALGQAPAELELSLGEGEAQRWYLASCSSLLDRRGFDLGRLMVLHDVTQLRQAQQMVLQQERALAALRERERLARELHDGIGQVLGYVSLQTEAARKLLDDGQPVTAAAQLGRLAGVARDAHADLREFILTLRQGPAEQNAFFPALSHYLAGFAANYGVSAELVPAGGLPGVSFAPEAQAHLFRIVQEALGNARQHGGARAVEVAFEKHDHHARVIIADDGKGFDPQAAAGGFGLRFMRERVAELGGRVEVLSAAGQGTRVVVELPLGQQIEE